MISPGGLGTVVALSLLVVSGLAASGRTRPPAVAGAFYPSDPADLRAEVEGFLNGAAPVTGPAIAVIAPHAGYVFSGATAGHAFAALRGVKASRVILLGPSHHAGFTGGALPDASVTAFATPLGEVPLDMEALARLRTDRLFGGPASAHGPEHSLEVELPFLQVEAPGARLVPVLVGAGTDLATATAMAKSLAPLLGPGTVVVASSDFTHHGSPYRWTPFPVDASLPQRLQAQARVTAGRAAAVDPLGFSSQVETSGDTICGARPITVLLELLKHAADATGTITGVATSADGGGDLRQLVAYAGVAFTGSWRGWRDEAQPEATGALSPEQGRALVALARATLESHLVHDAAVAEWFAAHPVGEPFRAPSGVFVTINNTGARALTQGKLRGCIGSILPREPLVDAVIHSAESAANDPRFPALAADELAGVELEVSVLTPPRAISGPDQIKLGRDGIILSRGSRLAVFLPQVAPEQGWDVETTLEHLARKAGLSADGWRGASFEVFTAQVFEEESRH